MMGIRIFSTPVLFLLLPLALFSGCNNGDKTLVIHTFCEEYEIVNDMEYSAEFNKEFFEKDGIKVSYNENSGKCGYEFKQNGKSLMIEHALTDKELYEECRKLYSR